MEAQQQGGRAKNAKAPLAQGAVAGAGGLCAAFQGLGKGKDAGAPVTERRQTQTHAMSHSRVFRGRFFSGSLERGDPGW